MNTATIIRNFGCAILIWLLPACNNSSPGAGAAKQDSSVLRKKPGAVIRDSLTIHSVAAVFFEPDSIQLEHIEAANEKNVFDAIMHEYSSQVRNAKAFLTKHWPNVRIITAKNVRYLRFVKQDGAVETVDLDTKNDAIGLFLFDPKKSPRLVDMMNIDDEVPHYFSQ